MGRNLQSMWGSVLALVKECLSVRRNLIVFHWWCLTLLTPATNQWKWFVSLPLAVAACMRMLFTFVTSYISWVLANIITESLFCFWICDGNSRCRFRRSFCPKFWADCSRLIYTHCSELMKSVVSDGSLSLPWLQCRLRWWSETLWVALMRLWAQLLLCYLQTVLWRFLCNLIDMWLFLIVHFWISSTLVAVLLLSQDNFFALGSVQVPNHAALVWRGDCTFTTKARIAQAAGAVSLIIVNDKEGLWTETEHSIHSIHLLVKIVNCQAYNASWLVLGGGIYALKMA